MVIYSDSPNNRAIAIPGNDVEIPLTPDEYSMTKLSNQLSSTV
ncbi:hypothetical protein [Cylindrospermopsis raciborskii]|nr:hypothetical protein [Cylindrospermopsis raciborskii]